jgi:hypothetical protein
LIVLINQLWVARRDASNKASKYYATLCMLCVSILATRDASNLVV